MNAYKYSICLSFAGEQRPYVEQVARELKDLGVVYFYDEDNSAEMWGHDLTEKFDQVFKDESQYCVMFISEDYARKAWTTHEKRSILERQLNSKSPYILPVRFDETRLPGLANTIQYQDARRVTPEKLAELIAIRINESDRTSAAPEIITKAQSFRLPKRKSSSFNSYGAMAALIDATVQSLVARGETLNAEGIPFFYRETGGRHQFRFGSTGNASSGFALDIWMGGLLSDDGLSVYGGFGRQHYTGANTTNGWGSIQQDEAGKPVIKYEGIGAEIASNATYTTDQFIDIIWNYICDHLED